MHNLTFIYTKILHWNITRRYLFPYVICYLINCNFLKFLKFSQISIKEYPFGSYKNFALNYVAILVGKEFDNIRSISHTITLFEYHLKSPHLSLR